MIELFSAVPSGFDLFENQHIIPVLNSEGAQSLSAILLEMITIQSLEKMPSNEMGSIS